MGFINDGCVSWGVDFLRESEYSFIWSHDGCLPQGHQFHAVTSTGRVNCPKFRLSEMTLHTSPAYDTMSWTSEGE